MSQSGHVWRILARSHAGDPSFERFFLAQTFWQNHFHPRLKLFLSQYFEWILLRFDLPRSKFISYKRNWDEFYFYSRIWQIFMEILTSRSNQVMSHLYTTEIVKICYIVKCRLELTPLCCCVTSGNGRSAILKIVVI